MSIRRALVVGGIAVLCEAVTWRDLEPDGLAAALYVTTGIAFVWFAVTARWRELPVLVAAFVLSGVAEEVLIYDAPPGSQCDPFCSSPMIGLLLGPPLALLLVPVGMFARVLWRDFHEPS
jgi:hypothetical protein